MSRPCLRVICLTALCLLLAAPALAGVQFASIGTGSLTGVYYPVGKAIASLVNDKADQYGLKVSVESTGGSVFNINAILAGDLDLGIVQSDRQYEAIHGLNEWKDKGPQKDLRAVCGLHTETFFLVAAQKSGITSYAQLKGKAVAVGNPGSGTRQNLVDILAQYGMSFKDLGRAEGLKASESAKVLQDGRIDAFVYTVGNPNGLIKESTSGRIKVGFIGVDPPQMAALLKAKPFYVKAPIPLKYYPSAVNKKDPITFAVKATLVTRAQTPEAVVYAVTKEIFENFARFQKLHPALESLNQKEMLEGLSAPLHPGALKYFREVGLK